MTETARTETLSDVLRPQHEGTVTYKVHLSGGPFRKMRCPTCNEELLITYEPHIEAAEADLAEAVRLLRNLVTFSTEVAVRVPPQAKFGPLAAWRQERDRACAFLKQQDGAG